MKKLFIGLLLVSTLPAWSQLKNKVGSVTPADLALKKCEFDEEADAAILVDEGVTGYNDYKNLITYRYRKLKIFKETGKEHADFVIDFRSDQGLEDVVALNILVTNTDENGKLTQVEVDRKSIYRTKVNQYVSRLSVAVPQVKAGSIIEYSYRILGKHYGMLRDWYFQQDLPVYKSSLDLNIVIGLEMSYLVQYSKKYAIDVKPDKSEGKVYFEMNNIPALGDEPFMDAREDYVQKIIFQISGYATYNSWKNYMTTWDEMYKELNGRPDFGKQMKVNIGECKPFIESLEGKPEIEKLYAIYDYVRKNTTWNGRRGVVTSDGVKEAWKTGSGTAAEINLSLVNLLNRADLNASPVLVSERGHGKINKNSPFIDQFNNVYALVTIADKKYFLDATDDFTPAHLIPNSILNTTGYVFNARNGGLIDIAEPAIPSREVISITGFVSDDGEYYGKAQVISRDYARAFRTEHYRNDKPDQYIADHLLYGFGNVNVDSLKLFGTDADTVELKQTFKYRTQVQSTGDYSFLNVNLFSGFQHNPFISNKRFSTVNFGYNRSMQLNCMVKLPEHFKVDALPQSTRIKNEEGSVVFTREIFYDEKNRQLLARIKVDINKSLFTVDEYPALKEFYKKMIDLMNEQVVLKKI